jgi:hypothetical protein
MFLNPEIIKAGVEAYKDFLTVRPSARHPDLSVIKYKKEVFFKNLWNPFMEECRGLVVDKDFNIIQRPFKKIYNYGIEEFAPPIADDEIVTAVRKVNGFMVAVSEHNGQMIISTTGSLDSDFVKIAEKWVNTLHFPEGWLEDFTFLFECVDESDPHIIDEEPGMYLLGVRDKYNGALFQRGMFSREMRGHYTPTLSTCKFSEVKSAVKTAQHEGYVVYTSDGRATKIKSPYYLTKKFLMRKNMDKILTLKREDVQDEEFWPLIQYIQEVDYEDFKVLDEIARREYIEKWFERNQT